jgi:hypothetical protein
VLPPPSSATPPPPSRTPLIIGAVVVALGTLVAVVVLSRPSTPTGEIDDTPTKKPKPGPPSAGTTTGSDERDDGPKKKKPLREQIDALDAFVPIGSGSMQRHEVTREEYGLYLASLSEKERGKARPLKEWESDEPDASTKRLPVTWVSFERATRFCKAIDATLPTKEQWTEALDGAFPWGPTWPKTLEGIALGAGESAKVKEVETASKDKTSDGVYDLGGNVQEWTSSVADGMATVRGGSIAMEGSDAKAAISEGTSQFTEVAAGDNAKVDAIAGPRLGFRCFRGK